ncbi:hypothetical protein [Nocardia speluncae]|uniref:hypothetical protein n=1 Tax=Nocardia speluncae TaxID=419477 RepID=UPI000ABC2C84|nr:hypothetical protein [Nocardia speluncae]
MSTPTFRAAVVRTPSGPDSIEIIAVPLTEQGQVPVRRSMHHVVGPLLGAIGQATRRREIAGECPQSLCCRGAGLM